MGEISPPKVRWQAVRMFIRLSAMFGVALYLVHSTVLF
jgi:hypothetical protein